MAKDSSADALAQQARFVFQGTVLKLKGTTMKELKATDRTVVVRVDEVIHAPEALSNYAGQEITVQLGGRKKVKKGQQLVFFTNGLLFGDSVAVESVDHREPEKTRAALATADGDPVKRLAQQDREARMATADAVVSGTVASVRLPTDVVAARAGLAAEPAAGPISEHDPDWRIAEIQVDHVHQGSHEGKTAEVRFPSSPDVMWHDAPKLHPGNEGFFILHKGEKVSAAARSAPTEDAGEYVALHSVDFQPSDEPGGIKSLVGLD